MTTERMQQIAEPAATLIRYTGPMKLAMMMHRAGHKLPVIAQKLGIAPESVSRLLRRARIAESQLKKAAEEWLCD
jgi:DNA-binding transcriptional regulator LsrR (DeoR family)